MLFRSFIGLALLYSEGFERKSRMLTECWGLQLLEMMPNQADADSELRKIVASPNRILTWRDLEIVESNLRTR